MDDCGADDCGSDDCGSGDWDNSGLAFCSCTSCGFADCCSSGLEDGILWFSLITSETVSFTLGKMVVIQVFANWSIFDGGVELWLDIGSKVWFGKVDVDSGGGGGEEDMSSLLLLSVLKPS